MFIFRLTQVRTSKSEAQTGSGANSTSVDQRDGAAEYKIPRPRGPKGVWDPIMLSVFAFLSSNIICRLYKLTISSQDQVIPQLRGSLSDLVWRILVGPPWLGKGEIFFFFAGPRTHSRRPCTQPTT
jgi:hypothetical protein